MIQVLASENMERTCKRMKLNKGAASVDGIGISQTGAWFRLGLRRLP